MTNIPMLPMLFYGTCLRYYTGRVRKNKLHVLTKQSYRLSNQFLNIVFFVSVYSGKKYEIF